MYNKSHNSFNETLSAYTGVRNDIVGLIPENSLRILDVGCSNGALGKHLKELNDRRYIVGIEIDKTYANAAEKVLDCVINADLNHFDVATLYKYKPFDCIVCADVLEHLVDPWSLMKVLKNLLNDNGVLILGLPNIRHHSAIIEILILGRFPKRPRGIFDMTHLRWFTFTDAIALASTVGLTLDVTSHAVRVGDKGGGFINRLADKIFGKFANWWLIREFMVYQFMMRFKSR